MTNPIPDKALAQHIAVLGKTGSGKSYAIRGVVERLLDDEARCCVIDPTGTWWGLKSSATGKSGGYPVVIFGGTHADLPLGAAQAQARTQWKAGRASLHQAIENVLGIPVVIDPGMPKGVVELRASGPPPAAVRIRMTSGLPGRELRSSTGNGAGGQLPKGEAAVLAACIQFPDGLERNQLTVLTGYKRSTRDAYLQRLTAKQLVAEASRGEVRASEDLF